MKKHKWHKEICAWADGAEIEGKLDNEYGQWFLCLNPSWNDENFIYRIKPQPKELQYLYLYVFCDDKGQQLLRTHTGQNKGDTYIGKIKLEV